MKKLTDEILNKLIDNELSSSEIDELYGLIKNDEKLLSKTKAHQMVDDVLKKLEIENAPSNATELIMGKITNSVLQKEKKNSFFKFVIGAFVTSGLLVIGFIVTAMPSNNPNSKSYISIVKNKFAEFLPTISINISNDLLLIVTASFTIIILISFYFVIEEHKTFKQKLDNIL